MFGMDKDKDHNYGHIGRACAIVLRGIILGYFYFKNML